MTETVEIPKEIVTVGNGEAKLRRVAKRVKNPQAPEILMLGQRMIHVAEEWERATGGRCEGLAAPQIGVNLRVVILRKTDYMKPARGTPERAAFDKEHSFFVNWHVCINPKFISSEGMQRSPEGCLSVPGMMGETVRPEKVIFEYTDTRGKRQGPMQTKDKLSASVITHEIDHLNGKLYVDDALKCMETEKFLAQLNPADFVAQEGDFQEIIACEPDERVDTRDLPDDELTTEVSREAFQKIVAEVMEQDKDILEGLKAIE